MDEIYRVALRAIFAFVVLLALVRASGKRTIWEGTAFDFVLVLILGDMFDDVLWGEVAASQFVAAAGSLALLHTAVSILAFRHRVVHRLVTGDPALVIRNGAFVRPPMRQERVPERELDALLRHEGVDAAKRSEVRAGRIETDGQLSVLERAGAREAQRSDLG